MKLVEFVPPCPHPLWTLCRQMGIEEVVVKVNPSLTGLPAPWRLATLKKIVDGLAAEGLRVIGLEGDPFDMTPIKQFGEVAPRADADSLPSRGASRGATPVLSSAAGASPLPSVSSITAAREEALARYRELLDSMAALDIRLLCYNFMVGPGWSRTGVRAVRGGALATYFSLAETEKSTPMKTEGFATVSPSEKAGTVVEALAQSELKLTHAQVKVVSDKSHRFYDLDVLSVSAYVPARPQGCTNDLSVADMMANLAPLRDKLRRVAKIYGKPMMFGECGCGPRRYQASAPAGCDAREPVDGHEQATYYEAFIRTFKDEPWCHGFYWWRRNAHSLADSTAAVDADAVSAPGLSFAPQPETVEVLRRHYKELNQR